MDRDYQILKLDTKTHGPQIILRHKSGVTAYIPWRVIEGADTEEKMTRILDREMAFKLGEKWQLDNPINDPVVE